MNHPTSRVLLRSLIALLGLALLIACGACSKKKSSPVSSGGASPSGPGATQSLKQHLIALPVPVESEMVCVLDGAGIPKALNQRLETMLYKEDGLMSGADKEEYEALKALGFTPDKLKRMVICSLPGARGMGYMQFDFDAKTILDWAGTIEDGPKPSFEIDGNKVYADGDGTLWTVLDKNILVVANDKQGLSVLLKTRKGEHASVLENPTMKPLLAAAPKEAAFHLIGNPPSGNGMNSIQISGKLVPSMEISGQLALETALPPQIQPFVENYESSKAMVAQMVQSMLRQGGGQRGMPAELSEGYGAIVVDVITTTSLKYDAGTKTVTFSSKPKTALDTLLRVMTLGRDFKKTL